MGRYYNTNRFDGKFGFAVQSSSDPEIFGMVEQEPSVIDYYLNGDDEAIEKCKQVLDEQYDILGVEQEDRIYTIHDESEIWDTLYKKYYDKWFREYDKKKDGEMVPYASDKYENGAVEIKQGTQLALCRVSLGVKIYTSLVVDGYCSLTAEL